MSGFCKSGHILTCFLFLMLLIICIIHFTFRFQLYGDTDEEVVSQHWNEWLSIAHCMEASIRKAAKAALGKDKVKVQTYLNSGTKF